ncbi:MAG TPA: DinB family protein [Candidatus Angelobacter sp.]|nr:DinB family protein [Candidatus Angelobacter sp.]
MLSAKVPTMLAMLQDLVRHKGHANASLLQAIRRHETAAQDPELRRLLRHILLANRFWLSLSLGRSFALEQESQVPESLDIIATQFRETHAEELHWISQIAEADLAKRLETPFIPGYSFSVAEGMMQVCMHSHGHRAQCATRLRLLGGTPPATDFVMWLKERPSPDWS